MIRGIECAATYHTIIQTCRMMGVKVLKCTSKSSLRSSPKVAETMPKCCLGSWP
ncbi:hypothetical protein NG821_08825 [Prevotella cerevisiae]|uniref:Uncharacterized protein n=1 Tax=Segatella cerevisiae TaxID=2053716 RepID=A0ABT1BZT5_9BACT|nr:hypothetical protein [Segatella cerevisiae]MCO6025937.1 hypothetical protein [Segatella cerevisiae]